MSKRVIKFWAYDERTGDPVHDNMARATNRRLLKIVRDDLKVDCAGRRRKKHIKKVEGINYGQIILNVAEGLKSRVVLNL